MVQGSYILDFTGEVIVLLACQLGQYNFPNKHFSNVVIFFFFFFFFLTYNNIF